MTHRVTLQSIKAAVPRICDLPKKRLTAIFSCVTVKQEDPAFAGMVCAHEVHTRLAQFIAKEDLRKGKTREIW